MIWCFMILWNTFHLSSSVFFPSKNFGKSLGFLAQIESLLCTDSVKFTHGRIQEFVQRVLNCLSFQIWLSTHWGLNSMISRGLSTAPPPVYAKLYNSFRGFLTYWCCSLGYKLHVCFTKTSSYWINLPRKKRK